MLLDKALTLVKSPWQKPVPPPAADARAADETISQSGRIDSFLGGLDVIPVHNSRLVDIELSVA